MPSPQLDVETIAFQGHDAKALPLLVGRAPIAEPEWTRGGPGHPAAFVAPSADDHVSIEATFLSTDLAGTKATVFASRLEDDTGHVLRDVDRREVNFDATGRSGKVQFRVAMSPNGIELDRVRWQWHFQVDGGPVHDATISEHEVAIVLDVPQAPWTTGTPAPAERSHPWWEVLQHACKVAHGATTLEVAAERLTRTVFEDWGEHYYKWHPGAETFASDSGDTPLAFDCKRFLSLLDGPAFEAGAQEGQEDPREIVDCSDTTAILSTFAAILGCEVEQLTLFRELSCNILKKVGHDAWEPGVEFGLHEVAVSVPVALGSERVWDGCLMLSGDPLPIGTGEPTKSLLPTNLGGSDYLSRLLSDNGSTFNQHTRRGPLTRPIRQLSDRLATRAPDEDLEPTAAPAVVPGVTAPAGHISTFDPKALERDGWSVIIEPESPAPHMVDAEADVVARIKCGRVGDDKKHVRATVYLSPDVEAAGRRFDHLRRKLRPSSLERLNGAPGVVFVSPDQKTIVGRFMNVTYKIIDPGGSATAAGEAARLRTLLTDLLTTSSKPL